MTAHPRLPTSCRGSEFDARTQVVLLADGHSIGVAFDLRPVSTEARPEAWLLSLRDKIQVALSSAIPEHDDPWVLQLYVQDETRLDRLAGDIAAYAKPEAKDTVFSQVLVWLPWKRHLAEISRPGGLFVDKLVTGSPWQGKHRKVRGTLYRPRPHNRLSPGWPSPDRRHPPGKPGYLWTVSVPAWSRRVLR